VKLLVTAFGPFPGAPVNPTPELVAALSRLGHLDGRPVRIATHVFATTYAAVSTELPALVTRHKPDALVMFGLAARATAIRIETRARNVCAVNAPDAAGQRPLSPRLAQAGPADQRTGLNPARLLAEARASGVPLRLSRDAGTYLCNFAYWTALSLADAPPALFIHVPRPRPGSSLDKAGLVLGGAALLAAVARQARRPVLAQVPRHAA
jgi:pyroglutamyl-peptidase